MDFEIEESEFGEEVEDTDKTGLTSKKDTFENEVSFLGDSSNEDPIVEAKGNWGSKTEYILSLLGWAVGLTNVWRFPFICYRNGGGAFLIPYWIFLFLCVMPMFMLEGALGQFTGKSAISMWALAPIFKGAGIATFVMTILIGSYYQSVMAHVLFYFSQSFTTGILPWASCGNPWNTPNCLDYNNDTMRLSYFEYVDWKKNNETGNVSEITVEFFGNKTVRPPGEEYYLYHAIQLDGSLNNPGPIVPHLLYALMATWTLTFLCMMGGVSSVGKVVYFTATFPYIMITALLIRGLTLPGAMKGIKFYIFPDFSRLLEPNVWCDAAAQVLFSLAPGWGGLVTMGSYNKFRNNCYSDGIFIPIVTGLTSMYAGFAVFSVAGYMSEIIGKPVGEVIRQGPQMAFVMYPEVVTRLPFPHVWAAMFFLMLYTLGLDSMFVMMEAAITSLWENIPRRYRIKQIYILSVSTVLMFLVGLSTITKGGTYLFQIVDSYGFTHMAILICVIEAVTVGWIYGADRFLNDMEFMTGQRIPKRFWTIMWKYISVSLLLGIFLVSIVKWRPLVKYEDYIYPEWSKLLGLFFFLLSFLCIPGWAIFEARRAKGNTFKEKLRSCFCASKAWGPAHTVDRKEWELYLKQQENGEELNDLCF